MPRTIDFLPDLINDQIDAATTFTDPIVSTALKLVSAEAHKRAATGDPLLDALMDLASIAYERAAHTVRTIQGTGGHGPNHGHYSNILFARLAVADSIAHKAGHHFDIAEALSHLSAPLEDAPVTREEVEAFSNNREIKPSYEGPIDFTG